MVIGYRSVGTVFHLHTRFSVEYTRKLWDHEHHNRTKKIFLTGHIIK